MSAEEGVEVSALFIAARLSRPCAKLDFAGICRECVEVSSNTANCCVSPSTQCGQLSKMWAQMSIVGQLCFPRTHGERQIWLPESHRHAPAGIYVYRRTIQRTGRSIYSINVSYSTGEE
eukprot:5921643-Pleurochrysis_carterae.AAC.1